MFRLYHIYYFTLSKSWTSSSCASRSWLWMLCTKSLRYLIYCRQRATARFACYQSKKCATLSARFKISELDFTFTTFPVVDMAMDLTSGSSCWSFWSSPLLVSHGVFFTQRNADRVIHWDSNNSLAFIPREASSARFCFDLICFHWSMVVFSWISFTLLTHGIAYSHC